MGLGSSYWSEVIEVLREIIPIYDKVNSIISLGKDTEHRSRGISGRVFKGKRLPGHMGANTITIQNLEVVAVDLDKNVILVKGSVPGVNGAILKIRQSVKA